jgi:LacI family transcriptional regulator
VTRRAPGRVSIREVAAAAGVSLGTASRALNDSGPVSQKARRAVREAAQRLAYTPDAIARSMRTRSTGVVALLVSDLSNPLYAAIAGAIETRLQQAGLALLLANTRNEPAREAALIKTFRDRRVDGLVLGPCLAENPGVPDALAAAGMPVVALDRDMGEGVDAVHVDHYGGALAATRHLLNLGHRRIALLTPGSAMRPGRERIAGYRDAFRERGVAVDESLIRAEPSSMDFAFSESLGLLSCAVPPTAFICLGTRILAGALEALRHAGRLVPDDVSVLSIGDTDLARLFTPSITALAWDLAAVGTAAAELMLKQLQGGAVAPPRRLVVTTQLVARDSCGAARARQPVPSPAGEPA